MRKEEDCSKGEVRCHFYNTCKAEIMSTHVDILAAAVWGKEKQPVDYTSAQARGPVWVLSSSFPQPKDMYVRLIGRSEVPVGVNVSGWGCLSQT